MLWDRRKMYRILKENNIPMAKHFFVNRRAQPPINQTFLEDYEMYSKGKEEKIIEYAK